MVRRIRNTFSALDKPLFFVTLILFIFGLLNIVTASSSESVNRYDMSLFHYFWQHLKMLSIGLILGLIIISYPSKKYGPFAYFSFLVLLIISIYLLINGEAHKGAINWISIGGVKFQPSELSKIVIIVCLSLMFEKFYKKLRTKNINHSEMIAKVLIVGTFIPVIVFLQKDFGTMLIMLFIFGVMFLASPILKIEKVKVIGLLLILATLGSLIMLGVKGYILSEEQMERFDFINPCSKYETGGYQVCNGFIAIHDGGLLGLGIGNSKQKYSYIPEPHTDSVFAIIAEENGFLKSLLIFIAYIYILKRILNLASFSNTIRGRYICLGVASYIFAHILINLGGLFGVMPLTGVPLPFLSYGGSFNISLLVALSLVQRISIEYKNQKIKV